MVEIKKSLALAVMLINYLEHLGKVLHGFCYIQAQINGDKMTVYFKRVCFLLGAQKLNNTNKISRNCNTIKFGQEV